MAGKNGHIYAVDVQQELLTKLKSEALQHGASNISIVWGDIDEPQGSTLHDNYVDRVIVANVLFQVEKNEALATEAFRICKLGGLVLLVDWSDSFGGLGPQPTHIVSAEQGKALFERAGLTHVRDIQAGDHHYGMVFKK
jgi:ubiquinone/menaquinone biosynthesis C-methylase UbiE